MSLGRFGGSAPPALHTPAGGSAAMGDLLDSARERLTPSPEGMPAISTQLAQFLAGYGENLLVNGSMESWSATMKLRADPNTSGTISNSGTTVTGVGTIFLTTFAVNDLIVSSQQIRRISSITSDTVLVTATAFSPALSTGTLYGRVRVPDGWSLSGSGSYVDSPNTTSTQDGVRAVDLVAAASTATRLLQTLTISSTQNARLRNRPVTFSARVSASTASRVSLELNDGVVTTTSRTHVGNGSFETLALTITVDAAATQIQCALLISSGDAMTATADSFKLEEGAQATSLTASPFDGFLQPVTVTTGNTTTTNSATFVQLSECLITNVILTASQSVLLFAQIGVTSNDTAAGLNVFVLQRNGTNFDASQCQLTCDGAGKPYSTTLLLYDAKPGAGTYTYSVGWRVGDAATNATTQDRRFGLFVLPSA